MAPKVPTLYEWLGGAERLNALIVRFYQKVPPTASWNLSSATCRKPTSST
jgi:hypothetical protein